MRFLYLSLFLLCGCKLELCFRYMHPLTTQRHPISKQLLLYNRRRKSTTSNKKKSIDQQPNKIIDDTYNVVERNVDQIFEDYGVRDTGERTEIGRSERQQKQQAFGQNVLSRFSSRVQKLADKNLAIGASLSLLMVILSGLGISVSAMKTVFPGLPSYYVDNVVTVLLSKAFTPSLVVFLFLSSTFGLYKLAQISSDQTNYTE